MLSTLKTFLWHWIVQSSTVLLYVALAAASLYVTGLCLREGERLFTGRNGTDQD
jgi:hypothetical protein